MERGLWGPFWILGVLKPGFWWVIRFKLTSTLSPNVHNDCSIRGGPFLLLNNVLDTKGENVGGGIPLPGWGRFWILGYRLNQVFGGLFKA